MKKIIFLGVLLIISIIAYFLYDNAKQVEAWVHERVYFSCGSISESRQNGIFIDELKVDSIKLNNKHDLLLIEQIWIEKRRFKARNRIYFDDGGNVVVFRVSKKSPKPYQSDSLNHSWGLFFNQKSTPYDFEFLNEKYPHQYFEANNVNGVTFDFNEIKNKEGYTYKFDILRNNNQNEGKGRQVVGYIILSKKH